VEVSDVSNLFDEVVKDALVVSHQKKPATLTLLTRRDILQYFLKFHALTINLGSLKTGNLFPPA
jgi:hypothetical protein